MAPPRDRTAWLKGGDSHCVDHGTLPERPYRLLLLGPPGSGKGTQAEMITHRLGTCHLSTGDVFRFAKRAGANSPVMREALEAMQRGDLVTDETVTDIVRDRSQCMMCAHGFLLDGYPRTQSQAQALDGFLHELGARIDAALFLRVDDRLLIDRLTGRRSCPACGAIYHTIFNPSKAGDQCDACGGALVQRGDDRLEAVTRRLEIWRETEAMLFAHYSAAGLAVEVPAEGPPVEVFASLERALAEHLAARDGAAATH
ncbi:MAG: nucleoside monophosphate kinase [Candidatus Sumerlaeia bacterium]|nr:nucleoside monophosphate kinase [Candidatus Sumerlaeia bacterium]